MFQAGRYIWSLLLCIVQKQMSILHIGIMKSQRGRRIEDAWMDLGVLKGGWSLNKLVLDKLVSSKNDLFLNFHLNIPGSHWG